MSTGELVHIIKLDRLPTGTVVIEAGEAERAALAGRFGLPSVKALTAEITFEREGEVIDAQGRLRASFDQLCAISSDPFANSIDEPIAFRFMPAATALAEEVDIELSSDEPDEIEYDGAALDLGEAVAQSFGLLIDPYATGPNAEAARREAGILDEDAPSGPFAALAALKTKSDEP